jgi:hypothetical protein
MPQMKNGAQSSQSSKKPVELKNGTGSTTEGGKLVKNPSPEVTNTTSSIPKHLTNANLATTVAQQRMLLTKKPEGIQISRSKHWKFISSYHGP